VHFLWAWPCQARGCCSCRGCGRRPTKLTPNQTLCQSDADRVEPRTADPSLGRRRVSASAELMGRSPGFGIRYRSEIRERPALSVTTGFKPHGWGRDGPRGIRRRDRDRIRGARPGGGWVHRRLAGGVHRWEFGQCLTDRWFT